MSDPRSDKRDLVLAPSEYAFMQDVTKGIVKTYTGPTVINPTAQERPVVFKDGAFTACPLEAAVKNIAIAPEGYYLVLKNPSTNAANPHPASGGVFPSPDLEVGRKININGPCSFALWPGQMVQLIQGHQLRSNQFLLVRVYNEDEARKNWSKAVIKPVEGEVAASTALVKPPADLTIGRQIIIKGTDVSFYIPPTGVSVVGIAGGAHHVQYVREALTLERLEYCILVDQNGKKRYERGPQVVFPEPTETFIEKENARKFKAVELNGIQGIHIKVIAPYTDDAKKEHKAGDELFITGAETAIYFPREEHSLIRYDGKDKHFATAVPKGEARYLMNRNTGEISMVYGPAMLLPDPRDKVIVRRALTDTQCRLWYPGNEEALDYNRTLRAIGAASPTTRSGAVSEGDIANKASRGLTLGDEKSSPTRGRVYASNAVMDSSNVGRDQRVVGEEFSRASTYTQPRTVTLDTKYQGAPQIDVHNGSAIMVVNAAGQRKVVIGPATHILDYDEKLMPLSLSTGKPKTTDKLLDTVYLRATNNKISDFIEVETSDHVRIKLYLSHLVNFEGDSTRWFAVENYVKLLCDHVRSMVKSKVHKITVKEFYQIAADCIRDLLLGKKEGAKDGEAARRPGLYFEQNNMRLVDVDVLQVQILDERIAKLINETQHQVVQSTLELDTMRRNLELTTEKTRIDLEVADLAAKTTLHKQMLEKQQLEAELTVIAQRATKNLQLIEVSHVEVQHTESTINLKSENARARALKDHEVQQKMAAEKQQLAVATLVAETEAVIKRFAAAQTGFSEALLVLSNNEAMIKVAEALNIQRMLGGDNLSDTVAKMFAGTPIAAVVAKLTKVVGTNGAASHATSARAME